MNTWLIITIIIIFLVFCFWGMPKNIPDKYCYLYPLKDGIGLFVISKTDSDGYDTTLIEHSTNQTNHYTKKQLLQKMNELGVVDIKKYSKSSLIKKFTPSLVAYKKFMKDKLHELNEINNFSERDEEIYMNYKHKSEESIEILLDEYLTGTNDAIKILEEHASQN